jgi:integrase
MTETEFAEGMNNGHFINHKHRAYCVLLYYSGVRKCEALKARREQFRLLPNDQILYDVGERLKHSARTPAIPIPLSSPFASELEDAILETRKDQRVFPYSPATAYRIVRRVFKYPHYFRLSRITWFFQQGFTIAELHSWTGLSLKALDYYLGLVSIDRMGKTMSGKSVTVGNP